MKDTVFKDLQQVYDELQQQMHHLKLNPAKKEREVIISDLTEEQIWLMLKREGRSFALEA
ncbi:hypothetical protein [Agarilytica rhodophyticola]|uniref:hypothetical protein n=1 Tax=Agarilytica rhodophyticola TaxID=1737490 RepID=UPI000B344F51|nr:hypothetical protein [Agarilytica rhodophyticola]